MGNTIATEAGGENVDKNYWHGNNNSTSRSGASSSTTAKTTTAALGKEGPQLQRKASSFLEEPITHKLTERGEAIVTLSNTITNKEMHESHGIIQTRGARVT